MKTIITKIFFDQGIQFQNVAYTTNLSLVEEINENYDVTLGKFSAENRTKLENNEVSISEFFNNTSFVYEARTETDSVEDFNINEINNIDEI